MTGNRLVIISDLHISAGALDDCDAQLEDRLAAFCQGLAASPHSTELVINGDFLDFVQAPPWRDSDLLHTQLVDSTTLETSHQGVPLCFTEGQSVRKLESIRVAHPLVFQALHDFLQSQPTAFLRILPGNHDADFYWPRVRTRFVEMVCSGDAGLAGRIGFHLDQVYRPAAFPRIWIEHGHQYDPCNCFVDAEKKSCWAEATPPVFADKDGRQRLYECLGTRFLIKYLNEIDEAYPFVDNVKPFSRFLELFAASALTGGGSFKVAVAMWRLLGFVAGRVVDRPTDLLSLPQGDDFGLRERLAKAMAEWPAAKQDQLALRIQQAGYQLWSPVAAMLKDPDAGPRLLEFLSDHLELLNGLDSNDDGLLGLSGEEGTLGLVKGFLVNETKQLKTAARDILAQGGVDMVIMGHTHERVEPAEALAYINSGCWTRYLVFGSLDFVISWKLLKPAAAEHFPYRLDYVDITGEGREGVALKTFA